MKPTPTHAALAFLVLGALLVSSPATPGQSCSFKPVLQGRVCTKPGAPCRPPTVGSGNVGKCTTEGLRPEALACECQGAPTPSYNITLSLLTPSYIDTDVATSTITVIAFNGFTGTVNFSCTVSGMSHPAPSCPNPAPATVTDGSATSLLKVSASASAAEGNYTVTINAVDGHGRPPDNGAQSSSVSVSHVRWILVGGGRIAFLTFVALLALWSARLLWHNKRDAWR